MELEYTINNFLDTYALYIYTHSGLLEDIIICWQLDCSHLTRITLTLLSRPEDTTLFFLPLVGVHVHSVEGIDVGTDPEDPFNFQLTIFSMYYLIYLQWSVPQARAEPGLSWLQRRTWEGRRCSWRRLGSGTFSRGTSSAQWGTSYLKL